jgi:GMP synthase (glutamine-hydrolysing)
MEDALKVFVVDNGGQWTHREWRVLRYLGARTEMISNETPVEKLKEMGLDGLVLSGGAPRIGTEAVKLGRTADYLEQLEIPILGICLGCQFMALHCGGDTRPAPTPEFGKVELIVDDHDEILKGLPDRFIAWESHNDEIKTVPKGWKVLAHSENCGVQAIRHGTKQWFGLQFHPEVNDTEHGDEIFQNFLDICKRHGKG